jgi:hypothetical protein
VTSTSSLVDDFYDFRELAATSDGHASAGTYSAWELLHGIAAMTNRAGAFLGISSAV